MYIRKSVSGFTLLELLVVLLILAVLAGIAAPKFFGQSEKAKTVAAKVGIRNLMTALALYYRDNSRYPTTEQGLKALIEKPSSEPIPPDWNAKGYLHSSKIPVDPWGRQYQYRNPGVHRNYEFDLYSMGKNKDSDDDDIANWKL